MMTRGITQVRQKIGCTIWLINKQECDEQQIDLNYKYMSTCGLFS